MAFSFTSLIMFQNLRLNTNFAVIGKISKGHNIKFPQKNENSLTQLCSFLNETVDSHFVVNFNMKSSLYTQQNGN